MTKKPRNLNDLFERASKVHISSINKNIDNLAKDEESFLIRLAQHQDTLSSKLKNATSYEDFEGGIKSCELANAFSDLALKKCYFWVVVGIVIFWLLMITCLLFKSGSIMSPFTLDKEVLITLLGTTTINILFLLHFIGRYLFSDKKG